MLKAYKYRIYPNKQQEIQIQKLSDAVGLFIIIFLITNKSYIKQRRNL